MRKTERDPLRMVVITNPKAALIICEVHSSCGHKGGQLCCPVNIHAVVFRYFRTRQGNFAQNGTSYKVLSLFFSLPL